MSGEAKPAYNKPWLSFDDQVRLLQSRGLADAARFRPQVESVGYYRLSGYAYSFRQIDPASGRRRDDFFPDASMADVIALCEFDERLRAAVWFAIGHVELALRVQVGYELGQIDRYVHLCPDLLDPTHKPAEYAKFATEICKLQSRSREDFVAHFKTKYDGRLPIWVVTEILQLGQLVKLFEFAPYESRVRIAGEVGIRANEYHSWLKSLNIVRNVVAHHGRLWNRAIVIQPKLPKASENPLLAHVDRPVRRIYGVLATLAYLLRQLDHEQEITLLADALASLPSLPGVGPAAMGLPAGWAAEELWTPEPVADQ